MSRTTPPRPVRVERLFPELAVFRGTATRLHPRPGTPGVRDSSVGGPLLWPVDEPWPMCTERHQRRYGDRVADVRLRRRILREAWGRTPEPGRQPGPTAEERDVLGSLKRGRHAPWLQDTEPIPMLALAQLCRHDVPDLGDRPITTCSRCCGTPSTPTAVGISPLSNCGRAALPTSARCSPSSPDPRWSAPGLCAGKLRPAP